MTGLQQLSIDAINRDPRRPAIEFEHVWHNWGELRDVACGAQAALDTSVHPHAPVAFIPRNRPESIAALLGLTAQGRTIRMIYGFQSPALIAAGIERARPAAIIAHAEDFSDDVMTVLRREGIAAIALEEMNARLLPGFAHAGDTTPTQDEPHIEILTSGTTGPPKPFAISYELIERHFMSSALTAREGEAPESLPPFLLYFPVGNISGLYSTLPMLIRGQRIVLLERFSIEAWHDYVVRYRPAHAGLPPSFVELVLDADIPRDDLTSLRAIGTGAASLDPQVQQAFEERYGIPILISYGATEFAGPVAAMTAELHTQWGRAKLGTVGRALPGAQLRVVNPESGVELAPNAEGLLEVVSPRLGPGWIRTSDIAMIDKDGFLFLRGRADGAIIRGGFKLLPETIEQALKLHPAVSDVSVVGIPDRRLGEIPAAAIRLRPGMTAPNIDQIESHVRHHLPATHVPVCWIFCEDLPRTPSLKPDRAAVRRLFGDPI